MIFALVFAVIFVGFEASILAGARAANGPLFHVNVLFAIYGMLTVAKIVAS